MKQIKVTILIDVPEGFATPDVDYQDIQEPAGLYVPPLPVYDGAELVRPATQPAPGCPQHGAMTRYPAGTNKAGKDYSASWRCASKGCETKPIWD